MSAAILEGRAALQGLLVPLVKLALVGEGGATAAWRAEAAAAQARVAAPRPMLAALRLDDVWSLAVHAVEADPAVRRDETVNPTLPAMAPLRLDHLGATPFDLDAAVQAIRDAASFG